MSYLRETASNTVANKVRRGINTTIRNLAKLPQSHEKEHDISDDTVIFRRVLKWNYRIIYSIDEDEIIVSVVEITHTSVNPDQLKKKLS